MTLGAMASLCGQLGFRICRGGGKAIAVFGRFKPITQTFTKFVVTVKGQGHGQGEGHHRSFMTASSSPFSTPLFAKSKSVPTNLISLTEQSGQGLGLTQMVNIAKKRTKRKGGIVGRGTLQELMETQSYFRIVAYATCDELDLEELRNGLIIQGLYIPTVWPNDSALDHVIHVTAKYPIGDEPREIFYFQNGTVIFWNMPDAEIDNALQFLTKFQDDSYDRADVIEESEYMLYNHSDQKSTHLANGKIMLNLESDNPVLEKFTIANALALSVKLGIWESTLDKYVESIDEITEELKASRHLKLTRPQVLQKTGEIFALRNELNLNSDLLDTPDFYWEHEKLESLYHKIFNYLSISRRTDVMNEKLVQCCELLELISHHLNDRHHVRLEWMIIVLIAAELLMGIAHIYIKT